MVYLAVIKGLRDDSVEEHPSLLEVEGVPLIEHQVRHLRETYGIGGAIYAMRGSNVRLSTLIAGLGVAVLKRGEKGFARALMHALTGFDGIVVLRAEDPFFSPVATEEALRHAAKHSIGLLPFSHLVTGLVPEEIVVRRYLDKLDEDELDGFFFKVCDRFPGEAGTPYAPAYAEEFSAYFGNWRVNSKADYATILADGMALGAPDFPLPGDGLLKALNSRDGHVITSSGPFFDLLNEEGLPSSIQLIKANAVLLKREASIGVGVVSSFPRSVFLNITDVCNARCLFCTNSPENVDGFAASFDDITRMEWLKYVEELSLHGGIGEPLAHPRLIDILKHFKDTLPFLKVRTTTNASLMGGKAVKAIAGYLTYVQISLNAATKSTYEATMPPLKWERTLANIRLLAEEKYRLGTDLPYVNLSFVAHKDNIAELPELPALASSLGVNQVSILHYNQPAEVPGGFGFTGNHSLFNYRSLYDRYVSEAAKECTRLGLPFSHPPLFSAGRYQASREFSYTGTVNRCIQPWTNLYVRHRMDTYVCCVLGPLPALFPRFDWPSTAGFRAMWSAPALVALRRRLNTPYEPPFCGFCKTHPAEDVSAIVERERLRQQSATLLESEFGAGTGLDLRCP